MKIPAENARDLTWTKADDELGLTVESNEQVDTSRWTSIHQLVLKDRDGRFWETTYERGLTESQDIQPFEDDEDEIEFHEVEKVPVTTYEYRRIG